ncbi:MAG: efflux RND transporter periplasmic adaptor subunit [Pseudomonadota bacterium]
MAFRIKSSVFIAAGLAIAATAWIYSGQVDEAPVATTGSGDDVTMSDMENQEALPSTRQRALQTVRVMRSTAQPHRAALLFTGRTEAARRTILRAETAGRIVDVLAEESDEIALDAPILKIAVSDRPARLREADALIRQRQLEYQAAESLAGKGFQSETTKAEAAANLSAARAMREEIRVDLARTTIVAPFDGTLESRTVEIGDYVQAGDEVARIAELDPIIVAIQVSEREVGRIESGTVADIELVSGERFQGIVTRISTTSDPATRTFEVELEIANEVASVRDGMTAKVELPTQEVFAHQISPALLTLDDVGRVGVKAVGDGDVVSFYPIQIVEDRSGSMFIAGLPKEAVLIVVGQEYVTDGVQVRPVEIENPGNGPISPAIPSVPALSADEDNRTAEGDRL